MTNKTSPSTSVVIAVYNGEKYIKESIESVLNQTQPPSEIIVVDDGSTDTTAEIVKTLPIRYFYQQNSGQSAATNYGIAQSTGDYLAFNDADDLWEPNKLKWQHEAFTNVPELDAVFGLLKQFICPQLSTETASKIHCPKEPMNGYCKQTMMIRKSSLEQIGLFNVDTQIGDFIEWYALAKRKGFQSNMIPKVITNRRLHTRNMSVKKKDQRNEFAQILKRHLDAQKR
ncbi:glycosyltransferase family 2 protein [Reichenbachiella carrageenanivorans]|uniref:Glycosyltransferase family 2 protein n=1 Tax=Reichenbachiella carrageenanivorans TaxID=2979869 RepID=A0ABY6D5C4_9BACT|nr:glycosyltransferase family A protein [Reichenbachiella carrageenanivorans]UXX80820.1 glycosyltransferase family 2 protein [Reichenbachiella carrageenanivorans]